MDSLEWPTLQQRRRKTGLEKFFKFDHGLISISSSYMPRPTSTGRSSRKNNDYSYDILPCRTQYRQMSVFLRTVPDWNSLPQEIVNVASSVPRIRTHTHTLEAHTADNRRTQHGSSSTRREGTSLSKREITLSLSVTKQHSSGSHLGLRQVQAQLPI